MCCLKQLGIMRLDRRWQKHDAVTVTCSNFCFKRLCRGLDCCLPRDGQRPSVAQNACPEHLLQLRFQNFHQHRRRTKDYATVFAAAGGPNGNENNGSVPAVLQKINQTTKNSHRGKRFSII